MYAISYRPEVHEDLDRIPRNIESRIKRAIEQRLAVAPDRYGARLRQSLFGLWKTRVGDYRVVYELEKREVMVWAVCHRRDVYDVVATRWHA